MKTNKKKQKTHVGISVVRQHCSRYHRQNTQLWLRHRGPGGIHCYTDRWPGCRRCTGTRGSCRCLVTEGFHTIQLPRDKDNQWGPTLLSWQEVGSQTFRLYFRNWGSNEGVKRHQYQYLDKKALARPTGKARWYAAGRSNWLTPPGDNHGYKRTEVGCLGGA